MTNKYYRGKNVKSPEESASELVKEAIRDMKRMGDSMFLKRGVSDKFYKAGELYKKGNMWREAVRAYELSAKYAPSESYREKAKEGISSIYEEQAEEFSKRESSGIEKKVLSVMSITTLLIGLFFVSLDFTGYVVANPLTNDMQWIGLCFFTCGLVFTLVAIKQKYFSKIGFKKVRKNNFHF